MAKLISVRIDEDTQVFFETSDVVTQKGDPMLEEAGAGDVIISKSAEYIDKISSQLKRFSSSISQPLKNIADEVEVEFSIKLSADAGIVISSISTESSITMKLKWTKHN